MMNALFLLVSSLLLAAPGRAPSAEEQRLFDEGMRAYQAGNPQEADKAWRAGFAIAKDPAFLVRMAEAEEKAGQPGEAAESYHRYLYAAPDAADRAEIEQRLARLQPAGPPSPAVPPTANDTHEVPGAFGAGAAAIGAPTAGPGAQEIPRARGVVAPAARDDELGRNTADAAELSRWNAFNLTAWIGAGATVVLLGASAYLAASAASSKDDVNRLLRYQDPVTGAPLEYHTVAVQYESATRRGQRDDRWAKGTLFAAAGTAVIATVFFVLDAVRTPAEPVVERKQAQGPGLGLSVLSDGGRVTAFSALRWAF